MFGFFNAIPHVYQALIGGLFTFLITVLGCSIVFFFKKINDNLLDIILGISAGIMLSASFFSLLNPSLELAEKLNMIPWLVAFIGLFIGSLLLYFGKLFFNKKNKQNRSFLLLLSITLHNIPEGLAIGVAFGSIKYGLSSLTSALILTLGIGLQNFPEGASTSLPLLKDGVSKNKAFIYGMLTAVVEPISSFIGAILAIKVRTILPFLLAFASGAMIYVVIEELIPESKCNNENNLVSLFTLFGFSIMMVLDVMFS